MVGGFPIPEVNRLMHAFMAGATEVNPDVKFTVSFIGSWYDPPKAKEAAFAMIDQGADVLYAERFGVSDAAKERGVKAVGNVIDTQDQYPGTVVASALWHMEPSIDKALDAVQGGTFTAEDYGPLSNLAAGGCSWRRSTRSSCRPTSSTWSGRARPRSGPVRSRSRSTTPSPSRPIRPRGDRGRDRRSAT